jgi:hypothetical protein
MTDSGDRKMISSCKGCYFAQTIGITQIGCELNKLEAFKNAGATVQEAEDESEEFYIIDRFCSTYRDSEWADHFDEPEKQILLETSIPVNFIVLHLAESVLEDLEKTLYDIASQSNKPTSVVVVVQNPEIEDGFGLRHRTHEYLDRANILFYIMTMIEKKRTELNMIDEAFTKCVNGYYSVFRSGASIPHNFILKLNEVVNFNLETISMIQPKDDLNGLTVQCVVHKFMRGSSDISVQKKVEMFAKDTDRESFIKPWNEYYE